LLLVTAAFLTLIPATPHKAKLTEICGNFFTPALHGQLAVLPTKKPIFSFHGIRLMIFKNAKNGRKKTGNLFVISCFCVLPVMGGVYSVFM
jgi:hypothetical protein